MGFAVSKPKANSCSSLTNGSCKSLNVKKLEKAPDEDVQNDLKKRRMLRMTIDDGTVVLNKRKPRHRIFVNRTLKLDSIKYFGFDMDYTLAVYHSPAFESLIFDMIIDKLIKFGYSKKLKNIKYDEKFPCRGLWFDKIYGVLLKVDLHGNVMNGTRGFNIIGSQELDTLYPNLFISNTDNRFVVMNTLYDLPEIYVFAATINYFLTNGFSLTSNQIGMEKDQFYISFLCLYQDINDATSWVHTVGPLKDETLNRINEFLVRDVRIPILLDRLRSSGSKTFLLTNSGFHYTNKIMGYLLEQRKSETDVKIRHWTSYFDYIVVDANKPTFFEAGGVLREIDLDTGEPRVGIHIGDLKQGHVYSRGDCSGFLRLIGAKGPDILYCGDHIFGDILKSKKIRGWRTFLVVPEMALEIHVWVTCIQLYQKLHELEAKLNNTYVDLDSTAVKRINTKNVDADIAKIKKEIDDNYGFHGSPFKCGSRQTFFSNQVLRFADLYAGSVLNIINYPFFYTFSAPPSVMPHEMYINIDEDID